MEVFQFFFSSWMSLLLVFVPAGFAVNYTHQSPPLVFAVNFAAVTGPSAVLERTVSEIQKRYRPLIGSLVGMSFR